MFKAQNALKAFKEARLQMGLNLVGAVGATALGASKIPSLLANKSLTISELKVINQTLQWINQSASGTKLVRALNLIKSPINDQFETFLVALSKISEANRLKFLKMLQDSKLTPDKLKGIIEESLQALKKCQ